MTVSAFKFLKANKIKQMGEKMTIGKEEVVIDPLLMLERALIISHDTPEVFEFELTVNPPAPFTSDGRMRLADDKSHLTDFIAKEYQKQSFDENEYKDKSLTEIRSLLQIEKTVLDMGSILRSRVKFQKGDTYGIIIQKYVKIVKGYHNCTSVFVGYDDDRT